MHTRRVIEMVACRGEILKYRGQHPEIVRHAPPPAAAQRDLVTPGLEHRIEGPGRVQLAQTCADVGIDADDGKPGEIVGELLKREISVICDSSPCLLELLFLVSSQRQECTEAGDPRVLG